VLIIPSLDVQPGATRGYALTLADRIHDWEHAGFGRTQLTISGPRDVSPDLRVLEDILREVQCPTQVAAALESTDDIDTALGAGAGFVVLSGRALEEMDWLASVSDRFPGQLLLSAPARERRTRTRGAVRTLPLDLRELAAEVADFSLAGLVVEFNADAPIDHTDLGILEDIAEEIGFQLQVSGGSPGLGTLRDLEFRGVGAAILSAEYLSAEFDEQTLARGFGD
jgi:phosphoribosylformimino-5-aminoimidazole carboxamide ribonucleotide (ProFAR) isomerase